MAEQRVVCLSGTLRTGCKENSLTLSWREGGGGGGVSSLRPLHTKSIPRAFKVKFRQREGTSIQGCPVASFLLPSAAPEVLLSVRFVCEHQWLLGLPVRNSALLPYETKESFESLLCFKFLSSVCV